MVTPSTAAGRCWCNKFAQLRTSPFTGPGTFQKPLTITVSLYSLSLWSLDSCYGAGLVSHSPPTDPPVLVLGATGPALRLTGLGLSLGGRTR